MLGTKNDKEPGREVPASASGGAGRPGAGSWQLVLWCQHM